MDEDRFDALTRALAQQPNRRSVLRLLGGGGLAAGLGTALGRTPRASAQGSPCTLAFAGTVRLGPSAGKLLAGDTTPGELRGTLTFTADQTGAITQGQLQLPDGTTLPAVGQASGRALNLRFTDGTQQVVVAVGTAAEDLATCHGPADGLLTGPQVGDLGDWHATLSGGGATGGPAGTSLVTGSTRVATTATATARPTATSTAQATATTTTQPTATTQPIATTQPTATIQPTTITCPECQTANGSGGCSPVADDTTCSTGHCCAGVCGDLSNNPNHCGTCGNVCQSGHCCNSTCVDESSDPNNCGACGNVCPAGHPQCINGTCSGCPAGETECSGKCVDTSSDFNNCGGCGIKCPIGQECINGACKKT